MARVFIPVMLRSITGAAEIEVAGATVGQIVETLDRMHPGLRARLTAGNAIAVDGEVTTQGLREPVGQDSEVHFIAAVKGGR